MFDTTHVFPSPLKIFRVRELYMKVISVPQIFKLFWGGNLASHFKYQSKKNREKNWGQGSILVKGELIGPRIKKGIFFFGCTLSTIMLQRKGFFLSRPSRMPYPAIRTQSLLFFVSEKRDLHIVSRDLGFEDGRGRRGRLTKRIS